MTLPFPDGVPANELIGNLTRLFTDEHQRAYGYRRYDPIELVSVSLRALSLAGAIKFTQLAEGSTDRIIRVKAPRRARRISALCMEQS